MDSNSFDVMDVYKFNTFWGNLAKNGKPNYIFDFLEIFIQILKDYQPHGFENPLSGIKSYV